MPTATLRELTRILFLAPFPEAGRFAGGISTVANGLKRRIDLAARLGCDLTFFNTEPNVRDPAGAGKMRVENLRNAYDLVRRLRSELETNRYDIVAVSSSTRLALLKDLVAIRAIAPHFRGRIALHVHYAGASEILFRNRALRSLQLGLMRRHVDDLILLSRATRDELGALGIPSERMHVLYNFQDISIEQEVVRSKIARMKTKDSLDVLFMGSLDRRKGIVDLLAAVSTLDRSRVRVHVCGTPNEAGIEEAMAPWLDRLGGAVVLHGFVSGPAKLQVLATADVLVLPSYGEGLPMVLLEAMAAGCAIVTTPVGAIPEVVTPWRNGILVDPGDRDALARAIRELIDDRGQLARFAAENADSSSRFTLDRFVTDLCNALRRTEAAPLSGVATSSC